jgi:DNA-binding response OmpR family regulator
MKLICPLLKGTYSKAVTDETSADETTVLIVEDEEDLADMYAAYLDDSYDVEVVYSGQDALDALDDSIDIVLLDRRMPVVSGNEVLAHIEEKGFECRVAMVTAVNPDFDIIDLRIDDYLVKPVSRDDVVSTVSRMLKLDEYNERMQKLTSKKLKRNVLEVEKTKAELSESEEFNRLNEEIENLEAEIDTIVDDLDIEDLGRHL